MTQRTTGERENMLGLVLFTQKFAVFVEAGLSLVCCLTLLEQTPAPYGDGARKLRAEIEEGATLSRVMAARPDLFSRFYTTMVRAGEIGGNLDETLLHMADLLNREWKLVCRNPGLQDAVLLFPRSTGSDLPDWADLSDYRKTLAQMEFCRMLGWLLASGVPILQALDVTGELLPGGMREALDQARSVISTGDSLSAPLAATGLFAPLVIELVAVGEKRGSLNTQLDQAASLLEHELDSRLAAESSAVCG